MARNTDGAGDLNASRQAARLLQNQMELAAKRLEQYDEPVALAELIAKHYVRLAQVALTLSKIANQSQYVFPIPESTAQVIAHLYAEITNDFRATFGYNPPWCYKRLGERGLSPDPTTPALAGDKRKTSALAERKQ